MRHTSLRTIGIIFSCITIFVILHGSIFSNNSPHPNIAHDFLQLETEFGANAQHKAYIDSLLVKAATNVKVFTKYASESEAITTLESIHVLIKNEGFLYKPNFLLHRGIETKHIDCDNFCVLYIAIAEYLKIPLVPTLAPNHSFVRLVLDDGSYLNWEPLEGKSLPNAWYIQKFTIAKEAIQNGVYLKSLSRKEFFAVQYNSIGSYLFKGKKFSDAIAHFSMAISLHPHYSSAYHNRGCAYYAIKRIELAFHDLLKASSLDPANAATHLTLADIYYDKKDYQKASQHYRAAIVLDPENYVPYHNWGILMKELGKEEIAQKLLLKANQLKEKGFQK